MNKYLLFLLTCALTLNSCINSKEPTMRVSMERVPAIVRYDANNKTHLITSDNIYLAPTVASDITDGTPLLCSYVLDYINQPANSTYYTLSELRYSSLTKVIATPTPDATSLTPDDYKEPLFSIEFADIISNHLFMQTTLKGNTAEQYRYEMTYNPNETNIPTLYIRAGCSNPSDSNDIRYDLVAFDITDFAKAFKDDEGILKFYICYAAKGTEASLDEYTKYLVAGSYFTLNVGK